MPSGPPPKDADRRQGRHVQAHGWRYATSTGWQDGRRPAPPRGLSEPAKRTWSTWLDSWVAAHWTRVDVPNLRLLVKLWEAVYVDGELVRLGELRLWLDTYGLTPKGAQDRRWRPPRSAEETGEGSSSPPADELERRRKRRGGRRKGRGRVTLEADS